MTILPIPNCDGYFADNEGNIYCNRPFGAGKKCTELRKLKPFIQSSGRYYKVSVMFGDKRKDQRIHRLICITFNGLPPFRNATVSHKDGNWKNNRPENLEWKSQKDNLKMKLQHGTDDIGIKNTRSSIKSELQLKQIRKLLKLGNTHSSIAKKFGIGREIVTLIKSGKRYKNQGLI